MKLHAIGRIMLLTLCLCVSGSSEAQEEGVLALLESTLDSMTTGEPALWTLFSTQGSVAVMSGDDAPVLADRGKLKADSSLAGRFMLPANTLATAPSLTHAGEFILAGARVIESSPSAPDAPTTRPLRDLWSAFWHPPAAFLPAPSEPQTAPAPEPREWEVTLAAVQDGARKTWRLVSLCVMQAQDDADQEGADKALGVLQTWERAMTDGDVTALGQCLNEDPFCVAVYTSDGQGWFFTYPEYFITMLTTGLSMGPAGESSIYAPQVTVGDSVAAVRGTWRMEIPVFEPMTLGFTAILTEVDDEWVLVSLCGGLLEW